MITGETPAAELAGLPVVARSGELGTDGATAARVLSDGSTLR